MKQFDLNDLNKAHKEGFNEGVIEGLEMSANYILALASQARKINENEEGEDNGAEEPDSEVEGNGEVSSEGEVK